MSHKTGINISHLAFYHNGLKVNVTWALLDQCCFCSGYESPANFLDYRTYLPARTETEKSDLVYQILKWDFQDSAAETLSASDP